MMIRLAVKVLSFIAVLLFCFGGHVLIRVYPELDSDYDVFLDYYYAKERLNEVLIALLFFIGFISTKGLIKSVLFFGFFVSFASMVDKVFLDNYDLMYSDIVVLVVALLLSYKVYRNDKHPTRSKRTTL